MEAKKVVNDAFGTCDILINGAGGNNPKGTTTLEYYNMGDEEKEDIVSFFDLDPEGVSFVFNLNFLGTLLPTQVFVPDMIGKKCVHIKHIINERIYTSDKNSCIFRSKSGRF